MMRFFIISGASILVALLTTGSSSVRAVNRLWLRSWIEQDDGKGPSGYLFVEHPRSLLSAAAFGVSLTSFMAGAGLALTHRDSVQHLFIDMLLLAVSILLFGQLIPRAIARRWAPQLVPVFVPLLRSVAVLAAPFRAIGSRLSGRIVKPHNVAAHKSKADLSDGLGELLKDGTLEGIGATEEIAIIAGVVQLEGKRTKEVMTPREDIFALDISSSREEMAAMIADTGFSRVPVYRGSLDVPVGMIHAFDVLPGSGRRDSELRPLAEADEDLPALELLSRMLRKQLQMALIRSSDGNVVGLVTLEDLLEEVVGDISDEHDDPIQ